MENGARRCQVLPTPESETINTKTGYDDDDDDHSSSEGEEETG